MDLLSVVIVLNLSLLVLILFLIAFGMFLVLKNNVTISNPFNRSSDILDNPTTRPLDQFTPDFSKKVGIKFSEDEQGRQITEEVEEKDNA